MEFCESRHLFDMSTLALTCVFLCFLPIVILGDDDLDMNAIKFLQGDIIPPKRMNAIKTLDQRRLAICYQHERIQDKVMFFLVSDQWLLVNDCGSAQDHVDSIKEAMADIEKHTCIRFKERTNEDNNYITIVNGDKCCSNVGMEGGQQWISLASWGCFSHRTIVHELLHSVGLWHEQMRLDRDKYLTIKKENLKDKNAFFNFAMVSGESTSDYNVPYNYASVMHYGAWAFGNGDIVMEPTDETMLGVMGFGNANETDYEKVRRIYECKGQYPVVPPANEPCKDEWDDCSEHSFQCKTDETVIGNCRKTCGYCEWGARVTATPKPYCYDYSYGCRDRLVQDPQKCQNEKRMMERECALTCGFCDPAKTRPQSTTRAPERPTRPAQRPQQKPEQSSCKDSFDYCDQYANQCADETVQFHCPRTCGRC